MLRSVAAYLYLWLEGHIQPRSTGLGSAPTLYASATPPGGDHDTNWLPAPAGTFSLYIRCYWAQAPILDRSWTPHGRPTRSTRPITEESSSPQRNQARSIIAFLGWRATRPGTARM